VELLEQRARRAPGARAGQQGGLTWLSADYRHIMAQARATGSTSPISSGAHRLLSDEDHARLMQARLDARYRHILLDEFRTPTTQWQVLQSWLAAYESPDPTRRNRPATGGTASSSAIRSSRSTASGADPASSKRRRRCPRQYRAAHLRTNVTRRNAAVVTKA
jgi:ATP-dependent helicase/nuclease subunit A